MRAQLSRLSARPCPGGPPGHPGKSARQVYIIALACPVGWLPPILTAPAQPASPSPAPPCRKGTSAPSHRAKPAPPPPDCHNRPATHRHPPWRTQALPPPGSRGGLLPPTGPPPAGTAHRRGLAPRTPSSRRMQPGPKDCSQGNTLPPVYCDDGRHPGWHLSPYLLRLRPRPLRHLQHTRPARRYRMAVCYRQRRKP